MNFKNTNPRGKIYDWQKYLTKIEDMRLKGVSIQLACTKTGIAISTYYTWIKRKAEMAVKNESVEACSFEKMCEKCSAKFMSEKKGARVCKLCKSRQAVNNVFGDAETRKRERELRRSLR